MNLSAYIYRIQGFLQEAKSVLIVLRKEPDLDSVAASLALYLSLSQKGKQVSVICPDKMTVAQSDLFAIDKITDQLGKEGKNLVISFPYIEGSIEKVSYNIENNKFNLVIEPRGEENLFSKDTVEFSRGGGETGNYDLIITIGISSYSDLGKFQNNLQRIVEAKPTITIDNKPANIQFGTVRLFNSSNSSVSEIITLLLQKLNLPFDRDIADNLLKGIKEKTRNFVQASPDSFEAAAICMRKTTKSVPFSESEQIEAQPKVISEQKKAPPDWLKPKIFRSSSSNTSDDHNSGTIL